MNLGDRQKCETCFIGDHLWVFDEYFEEEAWGRCTNCNARALNEAQLLDLAIMQAAEGQTLIGACLGARKTGTTAAFVNRNRGVWLGVVPLHTFDQWEQAIQEFSPGTKVVIIRAGSKTGLAELNQKDQTDTVYLIGWEYARSKDWRMFKNIDGAFLDEVHRMAGFDTQTAKAIHRLNTRWRLGLSGTPANNKLHGLWNVLHWIWWGNNDHKTKVRLLRYKNRGNFESPGWLPRHFILKEVVPDPQRPRDKVMEIGGERVFHSVLDEIPTYIQHLEYETCCAGHPGGVNANLPDIHEPIVIHTQMTATQAKVYKQLDDEKSVLWLQGENGDQLGTFIGDNDMVRRLRKRQVALAVPTITDDGQLVMKDDAVSSKADAWLDLATDIVEPGDPVLVFTHSKQFARMITQRTNKRFGRQWWAAEWSGDVKQADREVIKRSFGRDGGPQVIVAVIAAIAEGTDGLQDVCRREVWLSIDENNTLNTQGIGRLNRTGQRRRTQRWDIVSDGTLEERVIKEKRRQKAVLDAALRATPEPVGTLWQGW